LSADRIFRYPNSAKMRLLYWIGISKPIEISAPELQDLQLSGVFATDNNAAFIAFLRSLDGVRVEVTDEQIVVSHK
jgi:ferric-dicitrate binding protein FerR (iron transport regulator)